MDTQKAARLRSLALLYQVARFDKAKAFLRSEILAVCPWYFDRKKTELAPENAVSEEELI